MGAYAIALAGLVFVCASVARADESFVRSVPHVNALAGELASQPPAALPAVEGVLATVDTDSAPARTEILSPTDLEEPGDIATALLTKVRF